MRASEVVILRSTNSMPRSFGAVVEEDPRRRVHSVRLAVVDGHVVAEHLRDAVRRARMERRELGLGRLADLAEHLRRRRLVEADRVVLRAADDPYRLQHAQHAQARDLGEELGLRDHDSLTKLMAPRL